MCIDPFVLWVEWKEKGNSRKSYKSDVIHKGFKFKSWVETESLISQASYQPEMEYKYEVVNLCCFGWHPYFG